MLIASSSLEHVVTAGLQQIGKFNFTKLNWPFLLTSNLFCFLPKQPRSMFIQLQQAKNCDIYHPSVILIIISYLLTSGVFIWIFFLKKTIHTYTLTRTISVPALLLINQVKQEKVIPESQSGRRNVFNM